MFADLDQQWSKPRQIGTIRTKSGVRMTRIERNMLAKIARGWSREKDTAQPQGLEFDIQFSFGCSWGRALALANEIRLTWPVS